MAQTQANKLDEIKDASATACGSTTDCSESVRESLNQGVGMYGHKAAFQGQSNDVKQLGFPTPSLEAAQRAPEAHSQSHVDAKTAEFAKKNGLTVVADHGQYQYHLKANGKDQVLFTTDGKESALAEAVPRVSDYVKQKEQELGRNYQVEFSSANESRGEVLFRAPTPYELACTEAALKKVRQDAPGGAAGSVVKLNFINGSGPGASLLASGENNSMVDHEGHVCLIFSDAQGPSLESWMGKRLERLRLDQVKEKFLDKTGVELREAGGRYEYHLRANGKDQCLFSSTANDQGVSQAEKTLAGMVADKEVALRKYFKVEFSTSHDSIPPYSNGPRSSCREPNLHDLAAIQGTLERRYRVEGTEVGSPGPKFYFLEKTNDAPAGVAAYYTAIDGRSAVVCEPIPGMGSRTPATEADKADWFGKGQPWQGTSVEAIIDHELAHHDQATVRNVNQSNQVPLPEGLQTPDHKVTDFSRIKAEYAGHHQYEAIGWQQIDSRTPGGALTHDGWALKGKDGYLYVHYGDAIEGTWYRIDAKGNGIDGHGKGVHDWGHAYQLNRAQMTELATVKPVSTYFPAPEEMQAEGLSSFRIGRAQRANLLRQSKALYDAVLQADQDAINAKYPPRQGEPALMIRNPDGKLVAYNHTSKQEIDDFEAAVRAQTKI